MRLLPRYFYFHEYPIENTEQAALPVFIDPATDGTHGESATQGGL